MNDKGAIRDNRAGSKDHRFRGRGRRAFWVIVFLGGALALVSYVTACAGPSRHYSAGFTDHSWQAIRQRAEWMMSQVDATDEQRQKIAAIMKDLDSEAIRWQAERQELKERFMQALQTGPVNPHDLAMLKSAGVTLTDQALSRVLDATLQVSQVLTAKQRTELLAKWSSSQ